MAKAQTSPLVKQLSAVGKTFRLEYEAKTEGALERFMAEIESLGQAHPAKREPWEMLANVGDWVTDTAEKKRAYTRLAKLDAERYSMLVKGAREELDWLRFLETPMELKFTASDGRKVGLAKLRGKVVLIYFCASWCPPCVHEFPIIKSVYDWYHKKGFEIVGISETKQSSTVTGVEMFKKVNVPVLGIVENMSTHICSQCGHEEHIFGEYGGQTLADEYDTTLLGQLPLDISIRENADAGTPSVVAAPDSQVAAAYFDIARRTSARLARQKKDYASKFPNIKVEEN